MDLFPCFFPPNYLHQTKVAAARFCMGLPVELSKHSPEAAIFVGLDKLLGQLDNKGDTNKKNKVKNNKNRKPSILKKIKRR